MTIGKPDPPPIASGLTALRRAWLRLRARQSAASSHARRKTAKPIAHPSIEPISSPALFFAWMSVSVIATLPAVAEHRVWLLAIALLPACAALWSRQRAGMPFLLPGLTGLVWGGIAVLAFPLATPAPLSTTDRQAVLIEAVVADRDDRDDSVQLILDQIVADDWHPDGLVRVTMHRKKTSLKPGDRVRLKARFYPMSGACNPGGFDYRNYLLENNIVASGSVVDQPEKIGTTDQWFWNRQRQRVAEWIHTTLPESQRGLTEALLVGKRGHLDSALQNALFISGTYHLVAISGLHLTLIGGVVFFFFRLLLTLILPLSRRWNLKPIAALLTLFPVTAYAFLAGWSVSTQRAYIMVALFLMAMVLRRERQSWRVLTIAAILVLSWQPSQLLNAGFQLSFLCVVVILYLMDHLTPHTWRDKLLFGILTTVAIELVTAPVSMLAFHRLTPYGLFVNFLMIPWVGEVSTPIGLIAMVVQPVFSGVGDWLLEVSGWTMEIYRWLIERSVTWPGADVRSAGPTLPGMALFVAALFVAGAIREVGRWAWRRGFFVLVALLGLQWPRPTLPEGELRLTVLDVGQALAVLVKAPGGGWSLFDAGGVVNARFDIGEAVISSTLWHYGVERLERVVVSHPQRDHMAGMARVMRNFPVGSFWLEEWSEQDESRGDFKSLMRAVRERDVPVVRFQGAAAVRDGEALISVLPPIPATNKASLNDRSLAVEILYGDHSWLLTGDMEAREESWLVSRGVLHPVDVAIAPHHGSLTSSTPSFVQAVRPDHVVFSVGAVNPWGFPKPEVVKRWSEVGARIWRTDRQGAISFISDGRTLTVRSVKNCRG
ncbi:MAG: DNA internalization-related competence protein ComEC/Rec2 [Magnetococcus sp. YQC-9]